MKTAEEYSDDVVKLWSKFDWDEINFNQFKNCIKNYIEQAQKEAYNMAIDDALEEMNDYRLEYDDPHDYSLGVSSVPNKEKEWIKKLKK